MVFVLVVLIIATPCVRAILRHTNAARTGEGNPPANPSHQSGCATKIVRAGYQNVEVPADWEPDGRWMA